MRIIDADKLRPDDVYAQYDDGSTEFANGTDFVSIEQIERQPEFYVMQSDEVCDYCDGYYCSGCREHSNFCGKRVAEVE